ncbi:MAG: hypothetical protein KBA31_08810 [Alphaproteobacteria bacterium]|nr:hypothetical protein [Alphaproteobacteria bacterium]
MALMLALIGLFLAAMDFFSLTERCERAAVCLRDRITGVFDALAERFGDSGFRLIGTAGAIAVVGSFIAILALPREAGGIVAAVLFASVFALIFLQVFLAAAVFSLHLLSLPRKGIVGSLGLLLAIGGVLAEMSGG